MKNSVKVILLTIGLSVLLAGCATKRVLQPTGGSRSDGTVQLSFTIGSLQKAVIDWKQAQATAKRKCEAWGYSNAEKFGGATTQCQEFYQGSCIRKTVHVPYQCTGSPTRAQ